MSQCLPVFPGPRDPSRRLLRSLIEMADPDTTGICSEIIPWASALYDGTVCCMTLEFAGADATARADDMARRLPEAEFHISGYIVCEVAVEGSVAGAGAGDAKTHFLNLAVLIITDSGV